MLDQEKFDEMDVPERALFVIDRYTDLFLGNLSIKLSRRQLLTLMYEARERLVREHRTDELLRVLTFLQETYGQDLSVEIGVVSDLKGMDDEAASTLLELEADAHFNAERFRHALICYQLMESYRGVGSFQERIAECLQKI